MRWPLLRACSRRPVMSSDAPRARFRSRLKWCCKRPARRVSHRGWNRSHRRRPRQRCRQRQRPSPRPKPLMAASSRYPAIRPVCMAVHRIPRFATRTKWSASSPTIRRKLKRSRTSPIPTTYRPISAGCPRWSPPPTSASPIMATTTGLRRFNRCCKRAPPCSSTGWACRGCAVHAATRCPNRWPLPLPSSRISWAIPGTTSAPRRPSS